MSLSWHHQPSCDIHPMAIINRAKFDVLTLSNFEGVKANVHTPSPAKEQLTQVMHLQLGYHNSRVKVENIGLSDRTGFTP